jgi:hypothetical protein
MITPTCGPAIDPESSHGAGCRLPRGNPDLLVGVDVPEVRATRTLVLALSGFALMGCADAPTPVPPASDPPAGVAHVMCEGGNTRLATPVVRAWEDGVRLRFDNPVGAAEFSLQHRSWPQGTSEGGPLGSGITETTRSIAPGEILVACIREPHGSASEGSSAMLEVVDPDGLYVPSALECGAGEQFRVAIDAAGDDDPFATFRRVPGVRSTDLLVQPLYPESPLHGPTAIVLRESKSVARIMDLGDVDGRLIVDACPGSGIAG